MKSAGTKRREELRDILDVKKNGRKTAYCHLLWKYVKERYRAILIAITLIVCFATGVYYFNNLIVMQQQVENLRAQIESALQMRQNTLPGLTIVVNRFIDHEKEVFLSAVEARENSLGAPKDTDVLARTLKQITGADLPVGNLTKLMAVAENYPSLVSNQSYQLLIGQITGVENQIYSKRLEYNDAVNNYNTYLCTFPANAIGGMMAFRVKPYFEWDNKPEWTFVADSQRYEPPLKMKPGSGFVGKADGVSKRN